MSPASRSYFLIWLKRNTCVVDKKIACQALGLLKVRSAINFEDGEQDRTERFGLDGQWHTVREIRPVQLNLNWDARAGVKYTHTRGKEEVYEGQESAHTIWHGLRVIITYISRGILKNGPKALNRSTFVQQATLSSDFDFERESKTPGFSSGNCAANTAFARLQYGVGQVD
ncbi:hypothetical protein B0H17DRAFT_1127050 [Mycena rosella]|uniref:Uncharacterized protein n=1 Tax=Mycena rosella TaxID=1033263 RepID=A0AAD7GS23_MYCRO|nr:hypothetical protein B0H17DRAFT_1127050 [Mycena rosella]